MDKARTWACNFIFNPEKEFAIFSSELFAKIGLFSICLLIPKEFILNAGVPETIKTPNVPLTPNSK